MKKIIIGLSLLLIVSLFAGCGNKTKTLKTEDGEVKINENKGSVEFETDEGKGKAEVGDDVELPDDFPKDVPIYKGAKITSSITNTTDDQGFTVVTHETDDDQDKVTDFYKNKLSESGYSISGEFSAMGTNSIMSENAEREVSVSISKRDDTTVIVTSVTEDL